MSTQDDIAGALVCLRRIEAALLELHGTPGNQLSCCAGGPEGPHTTASVAARTRAHLEELGDWLRGEGPAPLR